MMMTKRLISIIFILIILLSNLVSCNNTATNSTTTETPSTSQSNIEYSKDYSLKRINGHLYLVPDCIEYWEKLSRDNYDIGYGFSSLEDCIEQFANGTLSEYVIEDLLDSCSEDENGIPVDFLDHLYEMKTPFSSGICYITPTNGREYYDLCLDNYKSPIYDELKIYMVNGCITYGHIYYGEKYNFYDFSDYDTWLNISDYKGKTPILSLEKDGKSITALFFENSVVIYGRENDLYFRFEALYKLEYWYWSQIEDCYQHFQNMIADSGLTVEEWLLSFGFEEYDVPEGLLP